MQQTTNYALKKPDGTDTVDISVLNGNMDIVDSELKKRAIDNYAVTTNSGNAYSVSLANVATLNDGLQVRLKFNASATGPITLNINALGACKVFDYYGNQVSDVHQGYIANLSYDSGTGNFILQGKGGGGNAQPAHLLNGETATTNSGPITGTMVNNGAVTITPSTNNQAISIGYHNGSGYVKGDSNLISGNIKAGTSIFAVTGKSSVVDTSDANVSAGQIRSGQMAYVNGSKIIGTLPVQATAAQTITPGTSNITKNAGIYDGAITIAGDANLSSANIKSGVNIFGVSGKSSVVDTADATAGASQIASGQTAYVNGSKVVGNNNYISGKTISDSSYSIVSEGGTLIKSASVNLTSSSKVSIDANGNIYTTGANTVTKFTSSLGAIAYLNLTQSVFSAVADSAGNIYVGLASTGANAIVAKYDSNLNLIWSYTGINGVAYNLKLDASGNIYIATNVYLIKLNNSGALIWKVSANSSTSGALDIASNGTIICIAGGCPSKCDSSGNFIFQKSDIMGVWGLAFDPSGNIYVAYNTNSSSGAVVLRKLDASGNQIWAVTRANSPFTSVKVDSFGDVYVGGIGTYGQYTVAKYSSQGVLKWSNSPTDDNINSVYDVAVGSGYCYALSAPSGSTSIIQLNACTQIQLN